MEGCTGKASRISISCRSALDKRYKVKGRDVSGELAKSPRGSHQAADSIGCRRAFTTKSATNKVHTNATTLGRRMGTVSVTSRQRHNADIWQITF